MSAISPSPFVRFSRPEHVPPLLNGVQLVPEKDLAEQVSDVLLFLSSSRTYETSRVVDHVDFHDSEPDAILHWIALVIAWTLWLPLTLLGIVIVQFSTSHEELYQKAHANFWEDQLHAILHELTPTDPALVQNQDSRLRALFEEAINYDHLFGALLKNINLLPNSDRYIPVLLDCFSNSERAYLLFKLLDKLTDTDELASYMAHCLPINAGRTQHQTVLEKHCFDPTSFDSNKKNSRVVAGFMGIMRAAAKQPEGGLCIPKDDVVFKYVSIGNSRPGVVLCGLIRETQNDVNFIILHKNVIIDQIGRNSPGHQQLINLIHVLTEDELAPG